jgi:tripartite-type tricarboxylate transporter receptor subunit TctC
MELPRRTFLRLTASAAASAAGSRFAMAQAYPSRPVRIIVPYAPGGQDDFSARLIAQKLSERLGQVYRVENTPGGSGNIGLGRAAESAPDGYTMLLVNSISYVVNPSLFSKIPYDPYKSFAPVTFAVPTTQLLTVNPSLPVHTVADLVKLIRDHAGQYAYASPGIGTAGYMTGELFRVSLGLDFLQVPFTGAGPAINATVAGHTQIAFGSPAASVPQVMAGTLRALAVASKRRLSVLPDVPTMAEAGFPDIECDVWEAIFVPAGTPQDIVALLNREIANAVALPDVRERLAAFGFQSSASTPQEAAVIVRNEIEKWAKLVRAAGLKAD